MYVIYAIATVFALALICEGIVRIGRNLKNVRAERGKKEPGTQGEKGTK